MKCNNLLIQLYHKKDELSKLFEREPRSGFHGCVERVGN